MNETKAGAPGRDDESAPERRLEKMPEAARRALHEAQERRARMEADAAAKPREIGGRGGKDPARYGDWEVKGIAVDF